MGGVRVRQGVVDNISSRSANLWSAAFLAGALSSSAGLKTASAQTGTMITPIFQVQMVGGTPAVTAAARVELTPTQMVDFLGNFHTSIRTTPNYPDAVRTAFTTPNSRIPQSQYTELDRASIRPAADLLDNLLKFNQIYQALSSSPPNQEVVRSAEQTFGSVGEARRALTAASAVCIRALSTLVTQPTTTATNPNLTYDSMRGQTAASSEQAREVLTQLAYLPIYRDGYPQLLDEIAIVRRFLAGQDVRQVAAPEHTSADEAGQVQRQRIYQPTIAPFHILSSSGQDLSASARPIVTRELARVFEVPIVNGQYNATAQQFTTAQNFGGGIARALVYHLNPNSSDAATVTRDLSAALNSVPAGNSLRNDPNYQAAVAALERGDLNAAVNAILQAGPLGGIVGQLADGIYNVRVSTQAITLDIGLNTHIIFERGAAAFERYLANPRGWRFALLELGFQVTNSWLAINGQYERMGIRPNSSTGALEFVPTGDVQSFRQGFTPENRATTFRPSVTAGVGLAGQPFEITVYAELIERNYSLSIPVQVPTFSGNPPRQTGTRDSTLNVGTDQNPLRTGVGGTNWALGISGIELRPRERPDQVFRAYVPRRVGMAGLEGGVLAYATFDLTPDQRLGHNNVRIDTFLTPQFSYLLSQARVSAELSPQLVWNVSDNVALSATPTVRYEYNITGDTHRMDVGGSVGLHLRRGFGLSIQTRYSFNIDDPSPLNASPTGVQAGMMLDITPQRWFRTAADERRFSAERQVPPIIAGAFRTCLDYQHDHTGDLSNDQQARTYARSLAQRLNPTGPHPHPFVEAMRRNSNFTAAQTALAAGNLNEGIRLLRLIPQFDELVR